MNDRIRGTVRARNSNRRGGKPRRLKNNMRNMSHEFESGFFVRQPAWHRLGVLLPEAPTLTDAIRLAGLDWRVTLAPVFTDGGRVIATHRATVRESDGKVLGVVGRGYRPLQNDRAFAFFEPFLAGGGCELEAAGSLRGGVKVWVLARVQGAEGQVVDGDAVRGYFLLSNAHDGSQAVRAQFTTIRVVCLNTLALADERAGRGVEACLRVRHTAGVEDRLSVVQAASDLATGAFTNSLADYRRMAARRLAADGFTRYVAEVLRVPADARRLGQMPAAWEEILRSYHRGPGAQVPGVFGTYWGAYNAVADWVDHTRGVRGEDVRLDSAWFGSGMAVKRRALELALA